MRPSWMPLILSCCVGLSSEFVRPGDVVWDIGANLSLFTVAASHNASPAGHVLAVEPDILLARLLRRSASANHAIAQVDVLPVRLRERRRRRVLYSAPQSRNESP